MIEFHIKRVNDGWQINGDGDVYLRLWDARMAIANHVAAEGIAKSEFIITVLT